MKFKPRRCCSGYTFFEVLFAAAVLGYAIGGVVILISNLMIQEETAYHQAVALNLQENAGRVWQLGLSPTQVAAILPSTTDNNDLAACIVPSSGNSVTFGTAGTTTLSNSMGTLNNIPCTVTMSFLRSASLANTVTVYQPTIR